jgi:hypothetical protein
LDAAGKDRVGTHNRLGHERDPKLGRQGAVEILLVDEAMSDEKGIRADAEDVGAGGGTAEPIKGISMPGEKPNSERDMLT